MTALLETTTDSYLQALLSQITPSGAITEITELSNQALTALANQSLPQKSDEDWRFTDLSELKKLSLRLASPVEVTKQALEQFTLPEAQHSRIVFVNGVYVSELSDTSGLPPGIYLGNLAGLEEAKKPELIEYLSRDYQDVFSLLNTGGLKDIAIAWVEPDVVVTTPIHLLYLTVPESDPILVQPRTLVVAQKNSQLEIVEYYGAITQDCSDQPHNLPYCNNAVTDIVLHENAQLKHSRVQRESGDGLSIANTCVEQDQDSSYTLWEINLGAKLFRHNLKVKQTGAQTTTNLQGLILVGGKQVTDTHSTVALAHPHGVVNQNHKCIVDGQAQVVFNGKIIVPQKAQLTNAAQINRNLLLSPQGRVNTKPELQITADNVKCTHGATVSQLETDEVFYLRSRGLSEIDARHLLLEAFAAEILDQLPIPSLRKRLSQCVACRNY
ncbi:Fe-S cluster assembly protein SufD [Gloeocapsa sp. PCC 73106]|uniref:Fe-S cluster assembly protein SufD n=1 Tax=Gloeocapsa sp. PCC 73106 TaxID=102232 RepID=UPI0002AD1138|nr:Fe-S cluster assembly protein SufD [Gloeocapsa sp. PCC 73106]ELR96800.1 FeS assembly protein SufD [Gloeocapsa sp. PCC 73106]